MQHRWGLGFRAPYARAACSGVPVDCWELVTENHWEPEDAPLVQALAQHAPIGFHGVGLSIGGTDPLDRAYMARLKACVDRCDPLWVSDHLAFTQSGGSHAELLLPIVYTERSLQWIMGRVHAVQAEIGRSLVLENITAYMRSTESDRGEWAFWRALLAGTGAQLLLDVNNLVVNARNYGENPFQILEQIPLERVHHVHLGGHRVDQGVYVDTHDTGLDPEVIRVYQAVRARCNPCATVLEWDVDLPPLETLLRLLDTVRRGIVRPFTEDG